DPAGAGTPTPPRGASRKPRRAGRVAAGRDSARTAARPAGHEGDATSAGARRVSGAAPRLRADGRSERLLARAAREARDDVIHAAGRNHAGGDVGMGGVGGGDGGRVLGGVSGVEGSSPVI